MAIIERTRRLRPSTRKPKSDYRVSTEAVTAGDVLRLILEGVRAEGKLAIFEFEGDDLAERGSFHFTARRSDGGWRIRLSGARPTAVTLAQPNSPI